MTDPANIPAFSNHLPVRIRFGEGVSKELAGAVQSHGARRVLVVIDAELEERNPGVAAALATLTEASVDATRFVKPAGEPTIEIVDAASAALAQHEPEAVIAIGGGSVIDTAKAARLSHQTGMTFQEWLVSERPFPESPQIPLIAIPTTAGTGSEVSGGAVITDPHETRKVGIASPTLRAQVALVDPTLTHSVPPATTAFTGIDALAQAIAAMIARGRTPIGDGIALEAIRMIGRSLPIAVQDGENRAARSEMACGSLMAGLAMNISDCTAEHSLGQAIGALFHAPHGLTIGVVLAPTLERERRHAAATLERVADALGYPDNGSQDGSRAVDAINELLTRLQFPVLRAVGADESHIDTLTKIALDDFFHTQSPVPWSSEEMRHAFEAALAQEDRTAAPAVHP
jgi:alcohol dehydrogenase